MEFSSGCIVPLLWKRRLSVGTSQRRRAVIQVSCRRPVLYLFSLSRFFSVLPLLSLREGKYIPLPQRQREMNRERAERGPGGPSPHNRLSGGYRSTPPSSSNSSPRPPLPSAAGSQPAVSPSERSSPLSGRGGAYTPHHPQGSPSPGPGSGPASPYTPASPGAAATAAAAPSSASPPSLHGHSVPHSHSLPHSLSDAGRPVNGGERFSVFLNSNLLFHICLVFLHFRFFFLM